MFFAPGIVVDVVLMIAGRGNSDLEEIRVDEHGRRGHESSAGVAVDPDFVDIDKGMLDGQLFDRPLLIGQAIVPQVSIAKIMVPFGALGVTAAVPDLDEDEPELGQGHRLAAGRERLCHAFRLGSGIDIGDDRIFLISIKIEGLIHDAVEICDPVVGLDLERLGILEAGLHERDDIGRFQVQEDIARDIPEPGFGRRVDPRKIVDKIFRCIIQAGRVRGIPRIEELHPGPVEIDAVKMHEIRVFVGLAAAGAEEQDAQLIVHPDNALAGELARGDLVFELAVLIIEIVMAPAVALAPENDLFPVVDDP